MSVLHMISYDWDQPAAWELQVIAEERKKFVNLLSNKNIKNTTMFGSLLIASDVERHGTKHHFGPHALHSSSYSQVQLSTEGKMRSGAQVCQRLQRLSRTKNMELSKLILL